jgi:hypothetical protein
MREKNDDKKNQVQLKKKTPYRTRKLRQLVTLENPCKPR